MLTVPADSFWIAPTMICVCVMGNLSYAYDIIARNSPLHESGRNVEDTLFGQILDNKAIDNHKKARLLLRLDS